MLKIEDLKENEYYTIRDKFNEFWMIIQFKNIRDETTVFYHHLIDSLKDFKQNDWCDCSMGRKITKSTPEEICQLKCSINENNFISFKESQKSFNKSLVGRYFRAKIDNPIGIQIANKDDIFYQKNWHTIVLLKNKSEWSYSFKDYSGNFHPDFELLPEDYSPEQENKPNYIVGKWYTHTKWSPNSFIKFYSTRDYNSVNELERISQGYYSKNPNWSISYEHTLEEADMKIVSHFLPENHPDKQQNIPMKEEEFKVGQYVKNIDDTFNSTACKENNNYKELGIIGKITKVRYSNIAKLPSYEITWLKNGLKCGKDKQQITLAKLEEIDCSSLSNDEILEIAKQYFKVGTKIDQKPAYQGAGGIFTIKNLDFYWRGNNTNLSVGGTSIFNKSYGKFAKIISSPIENKEGTFILPLKWAIKVTTENSNTIFNWRTCGSCSIGNYCLYEGYAKDVKGYSLPYLPSDCVEITFEQFKEHVLGEKVSITEEIKPYQEYTEGLYQKLQNAENTYTISEDGSQVTFKFKYEIGGKELQKPEIIPVKVRKSINFEPKQQRVKLSIIKPKLLTI